MILQNIVVGLVIIVGAGTIIASAVHIYNYIDDQMWETLSKSTKKRYPYLYRKGVIHLILFILSILVWAYAIGCLIQLPIN